MNCFIKNFDFNSHAGGMTVARSYGFEIDFVRDPISGWTSRFFIIILKFILTPMFEIKIHEKNFDTKKFHFQSSSASVDNIRLRKRGS